MHVDAIVSELPPGFDVRRREAAAEGFIHIDRLWDEWQSGSNRFTQPGERLFGIWKGDQLAGIGGVNLDYVLANGLRIRRFYIRPAFRRMGAGRQLAQALLAAIAPLGKPVVLHAPYPASARFWEAMGFVADARDEHTHRLPD
jgi:GNAT superfamily N-acetyltransferase